MSAGGVWSAEAQREAVGDSAVIWSHDSGAPRNTGRGEKWWDPEAHALKEEASRASGGMLLAMMAGLWRGCWEEQQWDVARVGGLPSRPGVVQRAQICHCHPPQLAWPLWDPENPSTPWPWPGF